MAIRDGKRPGRLGPRTATQGAVTIGEGIEGEATIERVVMTGNRVESNPELELGLLVTLPGREPYRVSHRMVVSSLVLHNLGAGRAVPVRVDRDDPTRIAIG